MVTHKFKVGQVVVAMASPFGVTPEGRYEVVRLLPPMGMTNQYRLKSLKTGQERVTPEHELFPHDS
jgi:hypothetical protein